METTKFTTAQILKLIEEARDAELCRDIPRCQRILSPVWNSLQSEPLVCGFELPIQADILRLCGFVLSHYGRSHNLKDYQERGRNFLTRAIDIFDAESLPHKSAEAKVFLALCYWYEGAIAESEMILAETKREYENNQLHPMYFQICANRMLTLFWKGEYSQALELIKELSVSIDYCKDNRIKTLYYNQTGITYQLLGRAEEAVFNYYEAIKYAELSGNLRFCATNFNNLGVVYKDVNDFDKAHHYADSALKIYKDLGEIGWAANVLDTKAQIYIAEHKLDKAIIEIDESLRILREGEDYAGLIESLFTKCRILLLLDRSNEIYVLVAELMNIASEKIGEFAVKKYSDELAKLVYPIKKMPYMDEVKNFKANLIGAALKENDSQVTKAAAALGITHQNLSKILKEQLPELAAELGIFRRSRKVARKAKAVKAAKTINSDEEIILIETEVSKANLSGNLLVRKKVDYLTFVIPGGLFPHLCDNQSFVALVEMSEPVSDKFVILQNDDFKKYVCGILEIDAFTKAPYFKENRKDSFPASLDEFTYCGEIVGYCPLNEANGNKIIFKPFI